MATPEEYVGMSFGAFEILHQLGHGAEAEAYLCYDKRTLRGYVLRLSVADDDIWDGPPMRPPHNRTVEAPNARGSWHGKLGYEASLKERIAKLKKKRRKAFIRKILPHLKKREKFDIVIKVPTVYGIRSEMYLIPLSDPYHLSNSIRVDDLLRIAPADDLDYFELWEDFALKLLGEAHAMLHGDIPENQWKSRWEKLAHGRILKEALKRYMANGNLGAEEQEQIFNKIPERSADYPEFAEGLVLRLIGCVSRGRCTLQAAATTARCKYFRQNIGWTELDQLVTVYDLLSNDRFGIKSSSLPILGHILLELGKPVIDIDKNPEMFSLINDQLNFDEYSLFFQDFVGENRPYPTLEITMEN
ncbi:hypothetical protein M3A49_01110 [Paraburkholderia sp. CNPSo 3076]|uniref:hypothetical protein n=1 Tax=Paraburkholderia sp. CNPSo 3076 TaxID=2940936 RepID=UPI0022521006|nr:hypothetical protein [Paraburkholderia sp. CNPSo 3076]MCX5538108.1 hypothetical protein [Paraburkholderia sp. CNPSo 3076]